MDKQKLEETLKQLIRADGRSQASVARKLDVSPDTFNKWVRGVNRIPDNMIAAFCRQLNLGGATQVELMQLAGYTVTPVELPQADVTVPFKFATKITPNGLALDPSSLVKMGATTVFTVFSPRFLLPGTVINLPDPDPNAYYAFLSVTEVLPNRTISRLGWQWFLNGKKVFDFDMKVVVGEIVWLNAFDYSAGGIFEGNEGFGRGEYQVIISIAGNPTVDTTMTVV